MDGIPPLLTLQQLRETGPLGQQLLLAARHHVGEAGLEQAASLERLLVACRHHSAVTAALRSLGWALGQMSDDPGGTRAALLAALQTQLGDAERVEEVLAGALRDITSTPVIFISAAALNDIEQRAQQQLKDAERLVERATRFGTTPDERGALQQVNQGMQEALMQSAVEDTAGRAQTLAYLIQEAATRLMALPTLPDPVLADLLEDVALGLRAQAALPLPTRN
ncbi:hypothetical protein [uncultured Deinococcus sp.]|uniref:hypothetical protein n=1 Tax=uncultured Deinococcus sp. TaxID=158789 RepID=UPI0025F9258B|nr:hypothetical protein [uncultured Deinococcus sp.]